METLVRLARHAEVAGPQGTLVRFETLPIASVTKADIEAIRQWRLAELPGGRARWELRTRRARSGSHGAGTRRAAADTPASRDVLPTAGHPRCYPAPTACGSCPGRSHYRDSGEDLVAQSAFDCPPWRRLPLHHRGPLGRCRADLAAAVDGIESELALDLHDDGAGLRSSLATLPRRLGGQLERLRSEPLRGDGHQVAGQNVPHGCMRLNVFEFAHRGCGQRRCRASGAPGGPGVNPGLVP